MKSRVEKPGHIIKLSHVCPGSSGSHQLSHVTVLIIASDPDQCDEQMCLTVMMIEVYLFNIFQ